MPVHPLKGLGQRFGPARDHHQMDVVRHQAITHNADLLHLNFPAEQVEVDQSLHVAGQNELTTIATLCHMMRNIDDNHSGQTWH